MKIHRQLDVHLHTAKSQIDAKSTAYRAPVVLAVLNVLDVIDGARRCSGKSGRGWGQRLSKRDVILIGRCRIRHHRHRKVVYYEKVADVAAPHEHHRLVKVLDK